MALALLARIPGSGEAALDAARAAFTKAPPLPETALELWKATGERTYLEQAQRLFEEGLAKVPETYHDDMRRGSRLGRELEKAWTTLEETP